MVCKYCQAELEDGSTVCPVCGKALEENEQPEAAAEVTAAEETAEACKEEAVEQTAEETAEEAMEETGESAADAEEEVGDEEAAAKAEKREKRFVRITAIVACVVLVFALAAGAFVALGGESLLRKNELLGNACYAVEDSAAERGANTVVATIGDAQLTNVQLQMLYWDQVYNFVNQYYSYLTYLGLDYTQPLHEQTTSDGESTWEQYFLEGSLETWHQYQSLALEAEKAGFVLPADMQEFLDTLPETMLAAATANGFATVNEMAVGDYGPGSTGEVYEDYLRLYYTAISYFDSVYAQLEATDEEINAYYEANATALQTNYGVTKESGKLIDVRHILICPEGGTTDESGNTTYSEAEWKICKQKAQDLLDEFKAGEATESAFAQLAADYTEDPGSQSTGGLYELVYEGQMTTEFNDWCFDASRKEGDTGLVRTSYGYHIMYYVCGDEGWIRYSTEGVLSEKGAQRLEEILAAYPMEVNYRKIGLGQVDMG